MKRRVQYGLLLLPLRQERARLRAMTDIKRYLVEEVVVDHVDGLISRREALHRLSLMGLGAAAASAMLTGCESNKPAPVTASSATSSASPGWMAITAASGCCSSQATLDARLDCNAQAGKAPTSSPKSCPPRTSPMSPSTGSWRSCTRPARPDPRRASASRT